MSNFFGPLLIATIDHPSGIDGLGRIFADDLAELHGKRQTIVP